MKEPRWVPIQAVRIIHDRQIARHGGQPGLRDAGLLESGHARAGNRFVYGQADLASLAAAYAAGISRSHAFVDGNKRTGFVTALTFLRLNGYSFRPPPLEGVRMMEDLSSGALTKDGFADWLRQGMTELPR